MAKKKKSPSPQHMNVPTEPINLTTPSSSPIKEPSNISAEKLAQTLHFAEYTTEEIDQFFSTTVKDKARAASPTPPPNVSTFASKTIDSEPAAETSTVKDDNLIDKLREDIRVAEVLERHIKKENSTLKGKIHTVQDKYDILKKKYKTLKKQLK